MEEKGKIIFKSGKNKISDLATLKVSYDKIVRFYRSQSQ